MFNKSSIDVTGSNIFDILGTPTYLLVDKKEKDMMVLIDDIVHVFSDKEHYTSFEEECKKYEKCALIKATLGMVMYDVMNQNLNGISLHGYFEEEDLMRGTYISVEDIKRNRNIIETAYYIMACAMGEETNEATLYNISNKQFYFFGDPSRETIATEKDVDGEKIKALPIFMTQSSILQAKKELGVELDIGIDTLINIERMTSEDFPGFVIDPFGTVVSFIDRDSVRIEQQRHMATWTDDAVMSHLKYIANTDEMFIILSPDCDFKNGKGTPLLIGSPLNEFGVFLFEKKEDADAFIDARPEPSFGNIRPIGVINPEEELKEFIENLVSNGIEHVFFNANSDYHLYMTLQEVYKIIYGKDLIKPENVLEAMAFPIAESCEDFQKDEKAEKLIQHIVDFSSKCGHTVSSMNLAYECSAEEIVFATNYANSKILKMLNEKIEDNDPDLLTAKDVHFDSCISLINKLMDRGDVYLICDNKGPIVDENGSVCIALSTKYFHDMQHMCPVKVSPRLIGELKPICKYITITDGNEIGTTISMELFSVCMQYITEELEPNKLKFFMHYAFNTNLSIMGIELLYQAVVINKTLYDEIIEMIDNDEKFPEKMIGLNDKTAEAFYTEENGCACAYADFVEYICDIIPDCD